VLSTDKVLQRLQLIVGETRCRMYDWRHQVHTCGDAELADLHIVGRSEEHGTPYVPTHPGFLSALFRSLDIDYSRYQFIDLGSGKGRVLLVASEFPFKRIVGVEFAVQLHKTALDNVKRYKSDTQRCEDITCVHGDAVHYTFPNEPTVLFMANPFGPPILTPVLRKLERSIKRHPGDVIFLCAAPFHATLVEELTPLRCIARERYHDTYRLPPSVGRDVDRTKSRPTDR